MIFPNFQGELTSRLQDTGKMLQQADIDQAIRQAITQRYSKDRARELVSDVPGNGTNDLPVPVDPANPAVAIFEDGFSLIRQVEFPSGQVPANVMLNEDWVIYRSPAGLKVRLVSVAPAATENVRMTWTARHAADGTTVQGFDFDAVCDFAASICFGMLAARYAQTRDAVIGADVVNYRTKSQEYLALAKESRKRYYAHMGIEEDAQENVAGAGPALAIGDFDNVLGSGVDRVTHPRTGR